MLLCVLQVELHSIVRCGLWLVIELIWNMFPSTAVSSMSLMACHMGILLGLRYQPQPVKPQKQQVQAQLSPSRGSRQSRWMSSHD